MDTERAAVFESLPGADDAPVLLTCEHASAQLPAPYRWPAADGWVRATHWAYDPGAAELTRELAEALDAPAVLSCFTRLLVDPNRPPDSATLIVSEAEGRRIALNEALGARERAARLSHFWQGYHDAVDAAVAVARAPILLALHTFTADYVGERREFELGVLFDSEQQLAEQLHAALAQAGWSVRLNEPYSGMGGFIYSIDRHARQHGRRALELELRQDRATDPAFRQRLVGVLAAWLRKAGEG